MAEGIRLAGLDLLSRLHIREGMALCITVAEPTRWGTSGRIRKCLDYLPRYGVHAKPLLPQLREMRASLGKQKDSIALFDKAIGMIESSKDSPTLVRLSDFNARPAR